ncbi:oocyte zinc finger protein XlCOF22-like [Dunckerocampus dactyliophorus]|uniref:oocyte zinc finger protein XlCOF22-like n=1 Tax=Dunckerocampus dactyliophorus TaxID=161453 RepID=UPI00240564A5|nr:oocyte zinc finger protein XlCOF22-like [Dunckerocampus dactyliophorus]
MDPRLRLVSNSERILENEVLPPDVLKVIVVKEEQQEWSSGAEQEDLRPARVKDEENKLNWTDFSLTRVPVKREDDQNPPTSHHGLTGSSAQRVETESDGDGSGGSETDPKFHTLHTGAGTSASSSTDDSDRTNEPSKSNERCGGAETRCHPDKKRFDCSECDKTFDHKRNLKRHMRRHTGEKPFCCSVCNKSFRQRSNLVVHSRTHTGIKPFACQLCHTSFSQRISLVLHVRTHTGEKPFPCSVCGERFSRKGTMMSHMRRHTGEKPFGCGACDKRFTFKCQVSKHKCAGASSSGK